MSIVSVQGRLFQVREDSEEIPEYTESDSEPGCSTCTLWTTRFCCAADDEVAVRSAKLYRSMRIPFPVCWAEGLIQ